MENRSLIVPMSSFTKCENNNFWLYDFLIEQFKMYNTCTLSIALNQQNKFVQKLLLFQIIFSNKLLSIQNHNLNLPLNPIDVKDLDLQIF